MIFVTAGYVCVNTMVELDFETQDGNICDFFDVYNYASKKYDLEEFRMTMFLLLPVVAYFLLNEPHDCYMCYGKDPDRVYSIFQLTLEERAKRYFRTKFNQEIEKEQTSDDAAFI